MRLGVLVGFQGSGWERDQGSLEHWTPKHKGTLTGTSLTWKLSWRWSGCCGLTVGVLVDSGFELDSDRFWSRSGISETAMQLIYTPLPGPNDDC